MPGHKRKYQDFAHLSPAEYRRKTRNIVKQIRRANGEVIPDRNGDKYWRGKDLQRYYGMTLTEYAELADKQDGRCGVCGGKDDARNLGVDHDHHTGKIRGLLCRKCNTGIGMLGDSLEGLMRAVDYLKKSS